MSRNIARILTLALTTSQSAVAQTPPVTEAPAPEAEPAAPPPQQPLPPSPPVTEPSEPATLAEPPPGAPAPAAPGSPAQPVPQAAAPGPATPPPPGYPSAPPTPAEAPDEEHEGAFARIDFGLGYGWVGDGDLKPEPGFKPIDELSFSGPVLAVTAQAGYGESDFALAAELMYERMLTRLEEPSNVSFQLFGIGIGAAYYFDSDFHLGAQLRYVGLLLWRRQIACFWDQGDFSWGPGLGATVGKEWFGDDDSGIGLAVQGNYAWLNGDPELRYASVLGKLTLTGF